ncbi:MAG TPA: hypothetical protein VJB16_07655, partial [archaeon]|nr:hypothetical protein [archaeon]
AKERYGLLERAADRMLRDLFGFGFGPRYAVAEEMLSACSRQESVYRILVDGIERAAAKGCERNGRPLDSDGWAYLASTTVQLMQVFTLDERTKKGLMHAITRTFVPQDTTVTYRERGIAVGSGLAASYRLLEEPPAAAAEEQLRERRRAELLSWFLAAPSAAQVIDSGKYGEILTLTGPLNSPIPEIQLDFLVNHSDGKMRARIARMVSDGCAERVASLADRLAREYPAEGRDFESSATDVKRVAADFRNLAKALVAT